MIRLLGRVPRGVYVLLGLAAAVAIGFSVWRLQTGNAASAETVSTARATLGDIIVSVGGVGKIVQTKNSQIVVPTSSGGSSGSTGGSASAGTAVPSGAVFPRAAGRLDKFLVVPGQKVVAGQTVALIDDGGTAAVAVGLASGDVSAAQVELRQKQTSDPTKGVPATPAELTAAHLAVISARKHLTQLLGPPRAADVSAARLDVKRAQADLETLRGGTPAAHAAAIGIATSNVQLAQERLARLLAGPDPADVAAATSDVKKAEADLDALLHTPPPAPLPATITAARQAVAAAQQKLNRLLGPPNQADVTAAKLDVARAEADLRTLEAGPSAAVLAAASQAVNSAKVRLGQLLRGPLPADVATVRFDVRKAQADLAVLLARGKPASASDIELARLRLQTAEEKLTTARSAEELLSVRASSAGTVTGLLTVPGAPVDTLTAIATVDNLKRLAVSVDLSEFDAAHVKRGMKAVVSVDALGGRKFPGKVLFAALTGTDNGGVVTFPVQVSLNRTGSLKPGMTVSVRIIVAERHDVVRVPLEAVTRDEEDRPIVSVPDVAEVPHPRLVRVGLSNNKLVEIKTNLSPGERVMLPDVQGGGVEEP